MKASAILSIITLLLCAGTAGAEQIDLVVNGRAYHFDRTLERNEENWGLGFEYEWTAKPKWRRFALANGFIDSMENMSWMAGAGMQRRFKLSKKDDVRLDLGLVAFLMTRQDFNGGQPFPGVLPAVSLGNSKMAINMTYIPPDLPKIEETVFFQFKYRISEK